MPEAESASMCGVSPAVAFQLAPRSPQPQSSAKSSRIFDRAATRGHQEEHLARG